jgi:hypothetical protein
MFYLIVREVVKVSVAIIKHALQNVPQFRAFLAKAPCKLARLATYVLPRSVLAMIRTEKWPPDAQLALPLNQRVHGNNLLNLNALPYMLVMD